MLGSQEQNLKQSQREILDDITTVRHNIQQVWGRIGKFHTLCSMSCWSVPHVHLPPLPDNSTSQLLTVLEEISSHYKSTLDSLQVWVGRRMLIMGGDQCQNSVFCNSAYVSVFWYSLSEIGCICSVRGGMCLCERAYVFSL